jgi:MFS family permease
MSEGGSPGINNGYTLLSLLFITYLVDSVFRAGPSALSNVLMAEFGLSYSAAGLVMSIHMVPYALMQVPSGIISDRPRRGPLLRDTRKGDLPEELTQKTTEDDVQ